ncbi:MAG: DinB family protein, partial [Chloroflexota bacterium]|nr:DinB family protein [Chloroflexota bacterium]
VSARGELLAEWVSDLRGALERRLARTPEPALHWRPAREMNSIGDTVWHVARWLDLVTMWLENSAPERQHWIADGWAERTGYDPRGTGTDGLGAISGYSFAEVEAIPKLRADQLVAYLAAVCDDLVPRLRAADHATAQRYKGVVQGTFGHLGEIAALGTLYERQAPD